MTTATDNPVRPPASLTASLGDSSARRRDDRGVLIGPWSDSVRRTNALLNSVRRPA